MCGTNKIKVRVRFTNLARKIVGQPEIELELLVGSTYENLVIRLGELYPGLVGIFIDESGKKFLSSNMLIINDNLNLPVMMMDEQITDGDLLTLISPITSG